MLYIGSFSRGQFHGINFNSKHQILIHEHHVLFLQKAQKELAEGILSYFFQMMTRPAVPHCLKAERGS